MPEDMTIFLTNQSKVTATIGFSDPSPSSGPGHFVASQAFRMDENGRNRPEVCGGSR